MAEKLDTAPLDSGILGRATIGGTNQDVADLSFEQAREELGQVVTRLEAGGEPLEGALALWERGEALAAHCQVWLDGARQRFEAITGDTGVGAARGMSFDSEPF